MKAVVQRVARASVSVDGRVEGAIERGVLVLLGIEPADQPELLDGFARRLAQFRMFPDELGKTNKSLLDLGLSALVVSQFTLCADLGRGRRPSFDTAERPERARALVEHFARALERQGCRVAQGRFGAHMLVELANDGPLTFVFER